MNLIDDQVRGSTIGGGPGRILHEVHRAGLDGYRVAGLPSAVVDSAVRSRSSHEDSQSMTVKRPACIHVPERLHLDEDY